MDLSTTDKIRQQLSKKEVNPKQVCSWAHSEDTEHLMITLKEMQASLEAEMAQSIESHVLEKEKTLGILKNGLPLL